LRLRAGDSDGDGVTAIRGAAMLCARASSGLGRRATVAKGIDKHM